MNDAANGTFQHTIETRWRDTDALGHINHATLLTYIENARIDLMYRWNTLPSQQSIIVASATINYRQQVTHPSSLSIETKITRIGHSSFDLSSSLYLTGKKTLIADAIITAVCFNYTTQKTEPVYTPIKQDFIPSNTP